MTIRKGNIILRGVVDPASLPHLLVADYQREILPASRINALAAAMRTPGGVPDIQLGMRGGSFLEREGAFYLQDEVYIIDGLQRRTAALKVMAAGGIPHLGATVHFNTTEVEERKRFRALNVSRVRLSPNVLLRNERFSNPGVEMLFMLCKDSSFALQNRVCWQQRMKRDEFVSAVGLLKVVTSLHGRFRTGRRVDNYERAAINFNTLLERVGRTVVRTNIKTFWATIDDCFKMNQTVYSAAAPYLRQEFLITLARLFANHREFWADYVFSISIDLRRKLSLFPLHDPHVAALCSAGGSSREILYHLLLDHINSSKRTRRLCPFADVQPQSIANMNGEE